MPSPAEESPPSLLPSIPEGLRLAADVDSTLCFSLRHIGVWEFLLCNWKSIEDFLVVEVGKKEEEKISWVVWCPPKVQLNRLGVRPCGLGAEGP